MDKFTRDFFDSILNDGGSPIYSSIPGKTKSSSDAKGGFKFGDLLAKKSKPSEEGEQASAKEPHGPKA